MTAAAGPVPDQSVKTNQAHALSSLKTDLSVTRREICVKRTLTVLEIESVVTMAARGIVLFQTPCESQNPGFAPSWMLLIQSYAKARKMNVNLMAIAMVI